MTGARAWLDASSVASNARCMLAVATRLSLAAVSRVPLSKRNRTAAVILCRVVLCFLLQAVVTDAYDGQLAIHLTTKNIKS